MLAGYCHTCKPILSQYESSIYVLGPNMSVLHVWLESWQANKAMAAAAAAVVFVPNE